MPVCVCVCVFPLHMYSSALWQLQFPAKLPGKSRAWAAKRMQAGRGALLLMTQAVHTYSEAVYTVYSIYTVVSIYQQLHEQLHL